MLKVVIYSGGMDSYTLLRETLDDADSGDRVVALSFYYGQRHRRELVFARGVCERLCIAHRQIDLSGLGALLSKSALTNPDIPMPEGHYEAESMKQTIVPGRNSIMLAIAAGYAESNLELGEVGSVSYGAHAGDHHIYPDCRPEFYNAMTEMVLASSDGAVTMHAPYMSINKTQILTRGLARGYDYGETWTCYAGGAVPCGKCGACQERAEAFAVNGVPDPLSLGLVQGPESAPDECPF